MPIVIFIMILATHAIIGGAIGKLMPNNPILAFALGFLSHFIADAIPHWHYPVGSRTIDETDPMKIDMAIGKKFAIDLFRIGIDFAIGLAASFYFLHNSPSFDASAISIFAGCLGGILPDPLLFLAWKIPVKPLTTLQNIHIGFFHSKTEMDDKNFLGICSSRSHPQGNVPPGHAGLCAGAGV